MGVGGQGFMVRVWGFGARVWCFMVRVWGLGVRVWAKRNEAALAACSGAHGLVFRGWGFGIRSSWFALQDWLTRLGLLVSSGHRFGAEGLGFTNGSLRVRVWATREDAALLAWGGASGVGFGAWD